MSISFYRLFLVTQLQEKFFFLQDLLQCGFEMTRGLVNDNRIFISKYVGGFLSPKMHTSNAF